MGLSALIEVGAEVKLTCSAVYSAVKLTCSGVQCIHTVLQYIHTY